MRLSIKLCMFLCVLSKKIFRKFRYSIFKLSRYNCTSTILRHIITHAKHKICMSQGLLSNVSTKCYLQTISGFSNRIFFIFISHTLRVAIKMVARDGHEFTLGCAVIFASRRNEAKRKRNFFRIDAKKSDFFACFASMRNIEI